MSSGEIGGCNEIFVSLHRESLQHKGWYFYKMNEQSIFYNQKASWSELRYIRAFVCAFFTHQRVLLLSVAVVFFLLDHLL